MIRSRVGYAGRRRSNTPVLRARRLRRNSKKSSTTSRSRLETKGDLDGFMKGYWKSKDLKLRVRQGHDPRLGRRLSTVTKSVTRAKARKWGSWPFPMSRYKYLPQELPW